MTCIVGLEHEGKVYIGGDSAGVAGWSLTVRADEKVFTRTLPFGGQAVFGFTTSFRMGQIIRYVLDIPGEGITEPDGTDAWLVTRFVPALREAFQAHGYQKVESDRAEGGTFLMGIGGRLYRIESDYQIGRAVSRYDAVGCGDGLALGSMHTTRDASLRLEPRERVWFALEAAEAHNAGVRRPFNVVCA